MSQSRPAKRLDYIVIGAGSAGCALANELAGSGDDKTVLVLEAGGSDRSPFIRFPAGSIRTNHDWGYWSEPDPSRNGLRERWERGRVLGGSSSVNSTVFVRGAPRDFDRWVEHGRLGASSGWSASQIMPLFGQLETSDQSSPSRGRTGPLAVRTVKHQHALTEAFVRAAVACGHPFNEDYNGQTQAGVAYAQLSQRRGMRCSSADAFLKPVLGRNKNITLRLNTLVHRIDMEGGRAVAVTFMHGQTLCREAAERIVICAGAINSPKLLMLSGIGDPEELECHQIRTVIALRGVGRHLKDHPLIKLVYRMRVPTWNLTGGLLQKLGFAAAFLLRREGPISNIFESVAFLKTDPAQPAPDVQLHFTPLGMLSATDGGIALAPYPSVSILMNKSYPMSSGRVRLRGTDPRAAPLIECRLLEKQEDTETLIRGIEMVRKIMQAEPIAGSIEAEIAPGSKVAGEAALEEYVKNHTRIAFHFAGTCRMGTGADSVVDPKLRVHGTENLWVADASVMPDLISGNTNGVCMMIGKKLGRELAGQM